MSGQDVSVAVAILAGGQSRRMGRNKALLPLGDRPLIAHIVSVAQSLAEEVLVVTRTPDSYAFLDVPLVTDRYPDVGPLAGVHAALAAASRPWVIVLACDMPFVTPDVLRFLLAHRADVDVVMPRVGGREEPLHAVYRREVCLPAVEAAIRRGMRRVISFLPTVRVRYIDDDVLRSVDPALRSFWNANTPEEWDQVVKYWQQQRRESSANER